MCGRIQFFSWVLREGGKYEDYCLEIWIVLWIFYKLRLLPNGNWQRSIQGVSARVRVLNCISLFYSLFVVVNFEFILYSCYMLKLGATMLIHIMAWLSEREWERVHGWVNTSGWSVEIWCYQGHYKKEICETSRQTRYHQIEKMDLLSGN